MIDFTQYPEVEPFITSDLPLDYTNHIGFDYKELPFNDKRMKYIDYLDIRNNELLKYLERGASGYAAQEDTSLKDQYQSKYEDIQELLNIFTISPSRFFQINVEGDTANCLGTDRAYDLYRNFVNYASRIQGILTYEEYYEVVLKDVLEVLNYTFNMDTRGQFYGYMDQQVKGFGDYLENKSTALKDCSDDWKLILDTASNFKDDLISYYNAFTNNILSASSDMNNIINPIIKFLNVVELGTKVFSTSWGSLTFNGILYDTVLKFSKYTADYEGDYFLSTGSNTYQITEQMINLMNDDRGNLEFIMSKATALSIADADIRNKLENIRNEIIIPN